MAKLTLKEDIAEGDINHDGYVIYRSFFEKKHISKNLWLIKKQESAAVE